MVKGSDLQNRSVEAAELEIRKMKATPAAPSTPFDVVALKARIEAIGATLPPPHGIYDGAVWAGGRDAAVKAALAVISAIEAGE